MKRALVLVVLAVLVGTVCFARVKAPIAGEDEIKAEAEQRFGEILDLWHEKKFDELYDKTVVGGRQSRENFADSLRTAPYRPACCWQQKQDVSVTVKSPKKVVVRAKIGLEGPGDIVYRTGSFKLRKEDGIWRVSRNDILSLSGGSGKKGYRKKKIRVIR